MGTRINEREQIITLISTSRPYNRHGYTKNHHLFLILNNTVLYLHSIFIILNLMENMKYLQSNTCVYICKMF